MESQYRFHGIVLGTELALLHPDGFNMISLLTLLAQKIEVVHPGEAHWVSRENFSDLWPVLQSRSWRIKITYFSDCRGPPVLCSATLDWLLSPMDHRESIWTIRGHPLVDFWDESVNHFGIGYLIPVKFPVDAPMSQSLTSLFSELHQAGRLSGSTRLQLEEAMAN